MNITPLNQRVRVYVPSTVNGNISSPAKQSEWTDKALTTLSNLFGGATALPAIGAWVSQTKGLIKEPVNIVFAATTSKDMKVKKADVLALALNICADMDQEAVTVEFGDDMFFVTSNNAKALEAA